MALRWYVVQAYSGYEGKVRGFIEDRVKQFGLEDKFGQVLVPTEEVVEMRDGQKRKSSRKFFPGYVLVEMDMDDESWHLVRDTPRVLGFIGGTKEHPAPISQKEADQILNRLEESTDKPRPRTLFEVGEAVRVNDGPFAEFEAVVERVNYDKSRLSVSVMIFGRSTPVELDFSQVEKG
ncbi:MAG: transcription termination/antitermination protein NusG [Enterobacterales bacterium]|nr:transcription termination/antitermination protein NusG [Enterobacterales bacterium]